MAELLNPFLGCWTADLDSKRKIYFDLLSLANPSVDYGRAIMEHPNKITSFVQSFMINFAPEIRLDDIRSQRLVTNLHKEAQYYEIPRPRLFPTKNLQLQILWPGLRFKELPTIADILTTHLNLR